MTFAKLGAFLANFIRVFAPPLHAAMFTEYHERRKLKTFLGFIGGFTVGQVYYNYLLKKIHLPGNTGVILSVVLSVILGIGNMISIQIRCMFLLLSPMYCGKAGRGVMKAVVLTYVIAGPITNMGFNAREVVRVFACTTRLSHNLTKVKQALLTHPFKKALRGIKDDISEAKEAFRSIRDVLAPIWSEVEGVEELHTISRENYIWAKMLGDDGLVEDLDWKYRLKAKHSEMEIYQNNYLKKLEHRCHNLLGKGITSCASTFKTVYEKCMATMPSYAVAVVCWPLRAESACNVYEIVGAKDLCDTRTEVDPGLGEGYLYLKRSRNYFVNSSHLVSVRYKILFLRELSDDQDADETGKRVTQAFEEKTELMRSVNTIVNICMAILFLRILTAAVHYHDQYLKSIVFDNVYITGYFKAIDRRRVFRNYCSLLPLKKMERNRYIDVHSTDSIPVERQKLVTQILKVMLEVITATTFVMLDRLFYEALDVVRQHAELKQAKCGEEDLKIEVKGTGIVANLIRNVLLETANHAVVPCALSNARCLPRPRLMPPYYFVHIYGGYAWILILLYFNTYTLRLRRLICSYFYPRREKQRILHLYNDILKKRLKLENTLRNKAVQSVRAYYLSGENLLSLRMKFPQILGWLNVFPEARMKCLICGDTEPRILRESRASWHRCQCGRCPFVCCGECHREAGARCLACDPSLADLSDVDSISDEEMPRY